jgi:structure-specific recognition protein 1
MASKKRTAGGNKKKEEPVEISEEEETYQPPKNTRSKSNKPGKGKSSDKEEAKPKPGQNSKKELANKSTKQQTGAEKKKKETKSDFIDGEAEYAPPKRAISGYIIFCSEHRDQVNEDYPNLKAKEVMAHLGKMWKKCSEAEKEEYEEKAKPDRERYERQMAEYESEGQFYDDDGNVVRVPKKKKRSMSKKKSGDKKAVIKKKGN